MKKNISTALVIEYLKLNCWNRTHVAQKMGVSTPSILNHIKKAKELGIETHRSGYDESSAEPEPKGLKPIVGERKGTGDFEKPIKHFPQEHHEDPFRLPTTHVPIDAERLKKAEPFANRIGLHLAAGNVDAARRMVDLAFAELSVDDNSSESLAETSITDIGIPVRTVNVLLDENGVKTLNDLLAMHHATLLTTPNFGARSLDIVWRAVLKFCFKQDAKLRIRLER